MRVLITGGAGYVGSHVLVELLAAGHAVHVVDTLETGHAAALARVRALAGRDFAVSRVDIRDRGGLDAVLVAFGPEAVIQCAGRTSPGESLRRPQDYQAVNVGGSRVLVEALQATACRRMVFSSSAAVYGLPDRLPVDEGHALRPTTPYGATKAAVEALLAETAAADPAWSAASLRYFNPVGAHPSARIGEHPADPPPNLVPALTAVATGQRPVLEINGDDFPTPDGTGVRDYLHVVDLARAHLDALAWTQATRGARAFNLGTGAGVSVREMVAAFEAASGRRIPVRVAPRRPGDVAVSYADPARAARELGWRARAGLAEMCASAWAWAARNPGGYGNEQKPSEDPETA
jgi:UDP-glucose 4-epimerase